MATTWIRSFTSGLNYVEDLNGVDWCEAPRPRRWHRCKPQTRGCFVRFQCEVVERCACGATRFDGRGPWMERNSRRKR